MTDTPHARNRLDDVGREALGQAAIEIVSELRGPFNPKISTRKEKRWGAKGSLSLVIEGSRKGLWFDHEIGVGGDILAFIQAELGCSFVAALGYASRFVPELQTSPRRPTARIVSKPEDESAIERRVAFALGVWMEARPLCGTRAEKYLRSRCIGPAAETPGALRFHPFCPWSCSSRPAMVALVQDCITEEPIAVHRTALNAKAQKVGAKLLGAADLGAVMLSPPSSIGSELTIGEGIETTMSAMALGFGPAWSVLNAAGIKSFPVLPGIERLTIIVDHDVSGVGQAAAAVARARWEAAGRGVRTVVSPTPGEDLNDFLRERAGKG